MNISLHIYWVRLFIATENEKLWAMIKRYYAPFLDDTWWPYDIHITLHKHAYLFGKKTWIDLSSFARFGDTIRIDASTNRYYFTLQEITCLLEYRSDGTIYISWDLTPLPAKHIINILLQWITRIETYYNRFFIKSCIHDPVFIALEKVHGITLLHATAVTNREQTFVFTGLWWSGKSTLAWLCATHGFSILADNYVLMKENTLFPFPELPRVTQETQTLLWLHLTQKADGIKHYLANTLPEWQHTYRVDKLFVCSYGNTFMVTLLEDTAYIVELLLSINSFTKEFPEHGSCSLLSVLSKFTTHASRTKKITAIAEHTPCYLLQNTSSLQENFITLLNV